MLAGWLSSNAIKAHKSGVGPLKKPNPWCQFLANVAQQYSVAATAASSWRTASTTRVATTRGGFLHFLSNHLADLDLDLLLDLDRHANRVGLGLLFRDTVVAA